MAEKVWTPRKRLLALLGGEQPDRVPWFADLDYLASALIGRGLRSEDFKSSNDYFVWHRRLRTGFYLQGYFPFTVRRSGCRIVESSDGVLRTRTIETPKGTLRETWRRLPASFTEAPVEHLVKSDEDLPAYRYLYEHTEYAPDFAPAARRNTQIGDLGINLCYTPRSPFMRLAVLDAGIETLTILASTAPEAVEATLAVMCEKLTEAVDVACAAPVDAIMMPENLSSEVVGKRFFHDYVEEIQLDWIERIHAAGKYSFIHIDGSLRGLLAEEAALGFSVLEALTPAPVGDLAVERWADFVAPSTSVLWGGIPGPYFTPQTNDAEFEAHVRTVLDVMRSAPRFVLGVADQVPPDGLERRVARVADLVEECGGY